MIIRKLRSFSPRSSLLTLYKSFVRPQLDYASLIYDQADNLLFTQKIKSIQYIIIIAITDSIKGSSREKLYQELGLESLEMRCWYMKLCLLYKIISRKWQIMSLKWMWTSQSWEQRKNISKKISFLFHFSME